MQIYSGLPGLCAGVTWLLVPYVAPFMVGTHEFIITRSYTGTRYSECNTLARVKYPSLYLGTPSGAYRFLICYIQSIVVDVLYPIATLVRSRECACIVLYSLYMHTIVFCTTLVLNVPLIWKHVRDIMLVKAIEDCVAQIIHKNINWLVEKVLLF